LNTYIINVNIDKPASRLQTHLLEWRALLFPPGSLPNFVDGAAPADHLQLYEQTLAVLERGIEMLNGS
jgi:hypothetical protein